MSTKSTETPALEPKAQSAEVLAVATVEKPKEVVRESNGRLVKGTASIGVAKRIRKPEYLRVSYKLVDLDTWADIMRQAVDDALDGKTVRDRHLARTWLTQTLGIQAKQDQVAPSDSLTELLAVLDPDDMLDTIRARQTVTECTVTLRDGQSGTVSPPSTSG